VRDPRVDPTPIELDVAAGRISVVRYAAST
jgi:hypothetical protein